MSFSDDEYDENNWKIKVTIPSLKFTEEVYINPLSSIQSLILAVTKDLGTILKTIVNIFR